MADSDRRFEERHVPGSKEPRHGHSIMALLAIVFRGASWSGRAPGGGRQQHHGFLRPWENWKAGGWERNREAPGLASRGVNGMEE